MSFDPPARAALFALGAFTAFGALAALLAACPGSLDDPGRFDARCSADQDVFPRRCAIAGCHDARAHAGNLDLETPGYGDALVGARAYGGDGLRIDPMTPDESILLRKLEDPPPFGGRMPLGAQPLLPAEVACVRAWVFDQAAAHAADPSRQSSPGRLPP